MTNQKNNYKNYNLKKKKNQKNQIENYKKTLELLTA